jgi:hypothetical protein
VQPRTRTWVLWIQLGCNHWAKLSYLLDSSSAAFCGIPQVKRGAPIQDAPRRRLCVAHSDLVCHEKEYAWHIPSCATNEFYLISAGRPHPPSLLSSLFLSSLSHARITSSSAAAAHAFDLPPPPVEIHRRRSNLPPPPVEIRGSPWRGGDPPYLAARGDQGEPVERWRSTVPRRRSDLPLLPVERWRGGAPGGATRGATIATASSSSPSASCLVSPLPPPLPSYLLNLRL